LDGRAQRETLCLREGGKHDDDAVRDERRLRVVVAVGVGRAVAAAGVVVRIQPPADVGQCSSSVGDGLQLDGGAGDRRRHRRRERAEHGDRGDLVAGSERGGEQGDLHVDVERLRGSRRRVGRPGRWAGGFQIGDPMGLGPLLLDDRSQAVDADDDPNNHKAAAGWDAIVQQATAFSLHGLRIPATEGVGKQAARGLLLPLQWLKLVARLGVCAGKRARPRAHHEWRQRDGHGARAGVATTYGHSESRPRLGSSTMFFTCKRLRASISKRV